MKTIYPLVFPKRPLLRTAGAALLTAATALVTSGPALAQTIGEQIGTMAQEGSTAGGLVGSTAMYLAALLCLVGGAWALWQSRQPNQRDGGMVGKGIAGLVLCGLFAAGGTWINMAAQTTSGGAATISDQAAAVTFN